MNAILDEKPTLRHDWDLDEIRALLDQPFNDLMYQSHSVFRQYFDPNTVQVSTLLNIKTGGCPEDCGYCSQSAHHSDVEIEREPLMDIKAVLSAARQAKQQGSTRFCMGAAWRSPRAKEFDQILDMVQQVKAMGMETCMTLGMLTDQQAEQLRQAGLDYYNHNLDTSPEYYGSVITTRTYQDRLDTLDHVRQAGMKVCSGGIIGMGESRRDRAGLLQQLANLEHHPESVPINLLVRVEGTPLADSAGLDPLDFIRTIAVARILMPASYVRLSAGRLEMSDEMQAWCFFAGANSIFYGDRLLTTDNPQADRDRDLFVRLGINRQQ